MRRGDVCWYTFARPDKRRPVLILTRDSAIAILNSVTVAPLTSTIRGIPSEVVLTTDDGVPSACAVNCDNIQTVPKANVGAPIAHLSQLRMAETAAALGFALGLESD